VNRRAAPPRGSWAYTYEIVPPQPEQRLREVRDLIADEHSLAVGGARVWHGRFILEERATHILVVADSPDQQLAANRRLEAALKRLGVHFLRTIPLPVAE
jgi:hypothetical protein